MNTARSDNSRHPDRPALWVTTSWDDGYPLDFRVAELLDQYGVSGTFYVPLHSQMPVMTPGQIQELARRFDIGGHTINHVQLDHVTDRKSLDEIVGSKLRIEDLTGRACQVFCPPNGRYRRAHLRQIREAGYLGVRTVELMSVAYPAAQEGLVILPVTVQMYRHGASTYVRNALKRRRWKNLETYFCHARGHDLLSATEALLEKLIETGGVFHLWGHSWELEHSRMWGLLEQILRQLWIHRERCRFVSNSILCEKFKPAARDLREVPAAAEGWARDAGSLVQNAGSLLP